LLISVETYEGY